MSQHPGRDVSCRIAVVRQSFILVLAVLAIATVPSFKIGAYFIVFSHDSGDIM